MSAYSRAEEAAAFLYQAVSARVCAVLKGLRSDPELKNDGDARVISRGRQLLDQFINGVTLVAGVDPEPGAGPRLEAVSASARGLSVLTEMGSITRDDEILPVFRQIRDVLKRIEEKREVREIEACQLDTVERFFTLLECRARVDLIGAMESPRHAGLVRYRGIPGTLGVGHAF